MTNGSMPARAGLALVVLLSAAFLLTGAHGRNPLATSSCQNQRVDKTFVLLINYTNCAFFQPGNTSQRPVAPGQPGGINWPWDSMDCILVNNSFPGPTLKVTKGDWVRVDFFNNLVSRYVNLHWHGLGVRGTPWADGTSFVNSCPVKPGEVATHIFHATETGTYFYHGHAGLEEDLGVSGAFIIEDPEDPHRSLYDGELPSADNPDAPLVIELRDWWKNADGHYSSGAPFPRFFPWGVPLVNGYYGGQFEFMRRPMYEIDISTDYCYRLRFVTGNTNWPGWFVNITDSSTGLPVNMTVIAHTAMNVEPTNTHSLAMYTAQRADAVLCTPASNTTFIVTVSTAEIEFIDSICDSMCNDTTPICTCIDTFQFIINVGNAPAPGPRTADRSVFAGFQFAEVYDPMVTPSVVKQQGYFPVPFPSQSPTQTWNIYLGIWGPQYFAWSDRGWGSKLPSATLGFTKGTCGTAPQPDPAAIIQETVLRAYLQKTVSYGEIVDIVFHNLTPFMHPMHLHGHNMWVMGSRFRTHANHSLIPGTSIKPDEYCGSYPDGTPKWLWAMPAYDNLRPDANRPWTGVNPEREHLYGCPYNASDPDDQAHMLDVPYASDIVPVPPRSWTKVRVKFDNPGSWYLHCHISLHMLNGMGFFVNSALDQMPKTPSWVDTSCGGACQPVDQACGAYAPVKAAACAKKRSDDVCAPQNGTGLYPMPQWQ